MLRVNVTNVKVKSHCACSKQQLHSSLIFFQQLYTLFYLTFLIFQTHLLHSQKVKQKYDLAWLRTNYRRRHERVFRQNAQQQVATVSLPNVAYLKMGSYKSIMEDKEEIFNFFQVALTQLNLYSVDLLSALSCSLWVLPSSVRFTIRLLSLWIVYQKMWYFSSISSQKVMSKHVIQNIFFRYNHCILQFHKLLHYDWCFLLCMTVFVD